MHNIALDKIVDQVFEKYDVDRSGSLDVVELDTLINQVFSHSKSLLKVSKPHAEALMKVIDTNHDGKIDRSELTALIIKMQDIGDISDIFKDHNGSITVHHKMHGKAQ